MGWPTKSHTIKTGIADAASLGLFVIPLFALLYTPLVTTGLVSSPKIFGVVEELLLIAAWTLAATGLYLRRQNNTAVTIFYLGLYHIFMAAYIVINVEVGSAFVYLWALLALITHLYAGRTGLLISLSGLFATQLLVILTTGQINNIAPAVFTFIVIAVVTWLAGAIANRDKVDKQELDSSKRLASVQHDRLLTVINNLMSLVIATDPTGKISVYNAATLNLLDTNRELTKQSIDDVLPIENEDGKRILITDLYKDNKPVLTRDDIYLFQGDERMQLELTISPIRSSYTKRLRKQDTSGFILIARDVTRAKSLEEEKDEFISVVSHELRTPITVAEGTISNVLAMIDKKAITPEKEKEAIALAHNQVIFLSKMINDLSTLSRAERGLDDETTRIDVATLIRQLFNEYLPSADKKGLHLNLDMPISVGFVDTSELYLKELLQNLITNAVKYTEEGSVTISATRTKETIEIAIKDTGIGISKNDQSHIMQRFFRSEDYRTRETGGTGLGLYVADKLARKIGTRINLRSRLNHGSTFWIELTAAEDDDND